MACSSLSKTINCLLRPQIRHPVSSLRVLHRSARFAANDDLYAILRGMNTLVRFPLSVSAVRYPRAGFESIPRDLSKAELFRYFTYSEKDIQEINLCRGV